MDDVTAAILSEYGVTVLAPKQWSKLPRHTHAKVTIAGLVETHGGDHLRDVLTSILQSDNNARALVSPIILAVSDLHTAHGGWFDLDASRWLSVFDQTDLLDVLKRAKHNGSSVTPRAAVNTVLFFRMAAAFDASARHLFPWMDYDT